MGASHRLREIVSRCELGWPRTRPPFSPAVSGALTADTPTTTVAGNTFIAPAGWTMSVRGPGDDPDGAGGRLAASRSSTCRRRTPTRRSPRAWAAYKPDAKWPLKVTTDVPDKDGWSTSATTSYQTSPNEKRDVGAVARRANDVLDRRRLRHGAGRRREARRRRSRSIFGRLLPKGYERETFAGKKAQHARRRAHRRAPQFVETGREGARRARACRSGSCRTARSCSPTASACASSARRRSPTATRCS